MEERFSLALATLVAALIAIFVAGVSIFVWALPKAAGTQGVSYTHLATVGAVIAIVATFFMVILAGVTSRKPRKPVSTKRLLERVP